MRERSWGERRAIARWYAERLHGGRSAWKQNGIAAAMTGADEWENTRELDAILEQANRPNYSPYDPIGLIRL